MSYEDFLWNRSQTKNQFGFSPVALPDFLFDFQRHLVEWALLKGRSAIFADCGLGKTAIELVWAQNVVQRSNRHVLIVTPLAVSQQTIREGERFGIDVKRCNTGKVSGSAGIWVTNYEKLHLFDPNCFSGVVCDESSAIKAIEGKRRAQVTEFLRTIPYRLMATATPAPNDYIELGTTSEALGVMGQIEMLNRYFKNDQNTSDTKLLRRRKPAEGGPVSAGWRFKGHAEIPFMKWVCGWARACRRPSDIGFSDARFALPPLIENEHLVHTRTLAPGMLFATPASNMQEEREERRRTITERCEYAASLVSGGTEPFVVWCHLNDEGNALSRMIPDAIQVSGSDKDETKEEKYEAFVSGQTRGLIIKPKIGAWGLNWQHCGHVVTFASHSYEQYYQAIRRCWRFGRVGPVRVDLVATEGEAGARENMRRKAVQADRMFTLLVEHMNEALTVKTGYEFALRQESPVWL